MGELMLLDAVAGEPDLLVRFRRNGQAKRYILRVLRDGLVDVTVPRHGTSREALEFAQRQRSWIHKQLERVFAERSVDRSWKVGRPVLLNGTPTPLRVDMGRLFLGDVWVGDYPGPDVDLRRQVEAYLRMHAGQSLPAAVERLNEGLLLPVRCVRVRNQRSRWGSCSRRGTLSLNWRLIQAPELVRDYIILHELAHLRHMNHSDAFWAEVERLCPEYRSAEAWLKQNGSLLREEH